MYQETVANKYNNPYSYETSGYSEGEILDQIGEKQRKLNRMGKGPGPFLGALGVLLTVFFIMGFVSCLVYHTYARMFWLLLFLPGPFLVYLNVRLASNHRKKTEALADEIAALSKQLEKFSKKL